MKRTHEPREFTNIVMNILEEHGKLNEAVVSLLNYMSDDDVWDWAICTGWLDPEDFEEDEEVVEND